MISVIKINPRVSEYRKELNRFVRNASDIYVLNSIEQLQQKACIVVYNNVFNISSVFL